MHNATVFQTHSWSSEMGDYVGMESCVDLDQNAVAAASGSGAGGCTEDRRRDRRLESRTEKKEFPPAIPLLERTEFLKRYYTVDGRLIIREEKVFNQEYFRAHRSNGCLTLQLLPVEDEEFSAEIGDDEEEGEDDNVEYSEYQILRDDDDDGGGQCEVGVCSPEPANVGEGGAGSGGKCHKYSSSVRSSPCMFGMPAVAAIRPVYI